MLIYSTYLGTDGDNRINGIAVDSNGDAYVTGYTNSATFPTQNPIYPAKSGDYDAFVAKLHYMHQFPDALLFHLSGRPRK